MQAKQVTQQWFTCKIVTPWGYVSAFATVRAKSERAALMFMRRQFFTTGNDHVFVVASKEA